MAYTRNVTKKEKQKKDYNLDDYKIGEEDLKTGEHGTPIK